MKFTITSLTLIAAASLPAFAGAETMSRERGPHCNSATATVVIVDMNKKADPLEEAFSTVVNNTSDPVLASYYRDLYRAPASYRTVRSVRTSDPLVDAISTALYGSVEPASRLIC